jgi:E3 ubiquitin-protein ligase MYCBP2
VEWSGRAVALDPLYNVLWSLSSEDGLLAVQCYNPTATDLSDGVADRQTILSPDLALPVRAACLVSRSQAALNLLSCLDTITGATAAASAGSSAAILLYLEEEAAAAGNLGGSGGGANNGLKSLSREDFSVVNRFDSHGGGWGYSGHSIEAVRFSVDTDIVVGGYGLFGGRGEYVGKVKLFDLGVDGGEQEGDGDLVAESDEVTFECGARQKFPVLFEEPVQIAAGRWYVAWARVSGPSSDCGSSGQSQVLTEDQVQFAFKSSKKSNNGTDVNAGQIPQILYRVVAQEVASTGRKYSPPEPVSICSFCGNNYQFGHNCYCKFWSHFRLL